MIKKLLFIAILVCTSFVYAQKKSVNKLVASPNPFITTTTITFNSTAQQSVLISVKNVLGKSVFSKKIVAHEGENSFSFDRNNLKSGIYIYAIQTSQKIISKRFVIK